MGVADGSKERKEESGELEEKSLHPSCSLNSISSTQRSQHLARTPSTSLFPNMAFSFRRACLSSSSKLASPSSLLPPPSSSRSFSISNLSLGYIGAAPVTYPSTTSLSTSPDSNLVITGPLGVQKVFIHPFVRLFHEPPPTPNDEGRLEVAVDDQTVKFHKNMWGTTRTLIANAIEGVSEGYRVPIKMVGVGYRGALEDAPCPPGVDPATWFGRKRLNLKLGFSHPVYEVIPVGITCEAPLPTKFILSGVDKQQLMLFAAKVRKWREPEPYRGKVSLTALVLKAGGAGRQDVREGRVELTFPSSHPLLPFSSARESLCEFCSVCAFNFCLC